jgi:hypothetical protein
VEFVSVGIISELGIPYENGAPVALDVKGFMAAMTDGVGPLCDEVAAGTMVVLTTDGKLGEASPVVTTVIGMDEVPVEVICSITGLGDNRCS